MAYIDRDKAIAYVEEQYRLFDNDENKQAIVEGCIEALKFTPTADVVEVKHGKWLPIVIQDNYLEPPYCDTIKCSECGQEADVSFHDAKHCYMCGAKMDGTPKERGEIHNE
jgi:hypothetical protein